MKKCKLVFSTVLFAILLTAGTAKAQNAAGAAESRSNSGSIGGDEGPTVVPVDSSNKNVKPAHNNTTVLKNTSGTVSHNTTQERHADTHTEEPATSQPAAATTTSNGDDTATHTSNNYSSGAATDSTNAATTETNSHSGNCCSWGWLGLIGLLGLFGFAGRKNRQQG